MFRIGGGVDSQGTGITSGMDTPRRGLVTAPGGYAGDYEKWKSKIEPLFDKRTAALENLRSSLGPLALMKMAQSGAFENVGSLWDIPQAIGGPEAIGATVEGLATMPKIDLKMDEAALTEATTMAKLLKPKDTDTDYQRQLRKIRSIIEERSILLPQLGELKKIKNPTEEQLQKIESSENRLEILKGEERVTIKRTRSRAEIADDFIKRYEAEWGFEPSDEDVKEHLKKHGYYSQGGRVGLQESFPGTVGEGQNVMQGEGAAVMEQNMQGMTTGQNQAMTQDPYQILRRRLPPEVSDDVVRLIAYNKEAFQDFANIQTQDDVTMFNDKWGVQLVVDVGSA